MTETPARFTTPPSLADLEAMAQEALASIPGPMRRMTAGLAIRIEDFPDEEVCADMALDSPFDLLGLYQGVALPFKSVADAPDDLDRVILYRGPILDYWCETGEDLTHVVRHVLIHEIGHHFGFSDDDMEAIESEADEDGF
ncbi:metallopeptidase family protein [Roseospira navarrensis]|uniref:Acetylglutamate kinase n=1 Tax=Roseospira navarrensis TaxID=140058 RepID=A0A7X2D248_9PROT|nr:metallopeptidase family protein [Roseospira navarrensis]MQX35919.1 acetylglutamate kinase [Roseospira navarrensis]